MDAVNGRSDGGAGRDSAGRFGKGNRFSFGNANNKRMHELRRALLESATAERVKAIGDKLYALALEGDVPASKLYLDHVCGRPAQAIEVSGLDGEPLGVSVAHLRTIILGAVGDDPAAQARIAAALRDLTRPGEATGEATDDHAE